MLKYVFRWSSKFSGGPALVLLIFVFSLTLSLLGPIKTQADVNTVRPIIFPVIGPTSYHNDFYAPRPSGQHNATDIIAAKGEPLIAAVSGTIDYVMTPEPTWGYSFGITDSEGYQYNYLHVNNDTPGTNDNRGGEMNAYAPDVKRGNRVEAGQLLGWLGDSGHSGNLPHLHFEIYDPSGTPINPYFSLIRAPHAPTPSLYPPLAGETLPYWVAFRGGLNLAMGDFNGDDESETVTAAGTGGGPHIKTYTGDDQFLGEFFAYDPAFRGGVDVATGDLNGDGVDEIITVPGPGGGPWVRVFNVNAQLLSQFAAYDPGFTGGLKVTAGDLNGDGVDEIITGPGPSGGPWVRVFDSQARLLSQFAAYDQGFRGGIDVASADTAGSSVDEIITAPGPGGGPHVRVFNALAQPVSDFFAYSGAFKGGVRVSAGNVRTSTTKAEIMTIPSDYGGSHVRILTGTGTNVTEKIYLETWWRGYYDVAAGNDISKLGTGTNRRASMRDGPN